jgi:hypothetical protein
MLKLHCEHIRVVCLKVRVTYRRRRGFPVVVRNPTNGTRIARPPREALGKGLYPLARTFVRLNFSTIRDSGYVYNDWAVVID